MGTVAMAVTVAMSAAPQQQAPLQGVPPIADPATFAPLATRIDPYVPKPRVIVLTDIANEPDDQMSFVRLLVSSNQFDIEGSRRDHVEASPHHATSRCPSLGHRSLRQGAPEPREARSRVSNRRRVVEARRGRAKTRTGWRRLEGPHDARCRGDRACSGFGRSAATLDFGLGRRQHAGAGAVADPVDATSGRR